MEGLGLAHELLDQLSRLDRRIARDVVDRLFRIERGALAAGHGERVDDRGPQLQHPELEQREQANRARADDNHIGLWHALRHPARFAPLITPAIQPPGAAPKMTT